jgi:cytochrome c peroxidase
MNRGKSAYGVTGLCAMLMLAACGAAGEPDETSGETSLGAITGTNNLRVFDNAFGQTATYTKDGPFDLTNPFFLSLGTNGRACSTCHDPNANWGIAPAAIQSRFDATSGTDPIFRTVDGANSPVADVSTVAARRSAYSMLLSRGLIRVGIGVPATAEFELSSVDDPYGYATARELSLFRRPLPTTNLKFLPVVMWDGRASSPGSALASDLAGQANGATLGHAEGLHDLTTAQQQAIVGFEMLLFSAQVVDRAAGDLTASMGGGGPTYLSSAQFWIGINDPLGGNPTKLPFKPAAFSLYTKWSGASGAAGAIARGEALFGSKPITLTGVRGLNNVLGQPRVVGTCTTCHDTPNVGNHSVRLPLDIGLTDASRRTPDMPLYTLRNKTTGETIQTTDPGRALVTGLWKDVALFKGPILRGLAARAPYFHNGLAGSLGAAVDFYDTRFGIGFTAQEKSDLVAFLQSL